MIIQQLGNKEIQNITDNIVCSFVGEKARRAKEGDVDREIKKAIARKAEQEYLKGMIEFVETYMWFQYDSASCGLKAGSTKFTKLWQDLKKELEKSDNI